MTIPEAIEFVDKKSMEHQKQKDQNRKRRENYKRKKDEVGPSIGENPALKGIESIEF
jgi:hypothetical protein